MYSNASFEHFVAKIITQPYQGTQEMQAPQTKVNINLDINEIPENHSNLSYCTPTPTKFIQDCEDVGLFSDLQNVNPFDEGFRKALIGTLSNKDKAMQDESTLNNSNESLHTPNILPIELNVSTSAGQQSNQDHTYFKKWVHNNDASTSRPANSGQSDTKHQRKRRDSVRRRETNRLSQRKAYLKRSQFIAEVNEQIEKLRMENQLLTIKNNNLIMTVRNLRRTMRIIHDKFFYGDVQDVLKNISEGMQIKNSEGLLETDEQPVSIASVIISAKTKFILPKAPNTN